MLATLQFDNPIVFESLHTTVMGFCIMMIVHLVRVEHGQLKQRGLLKYILNRYNWVDTAHLLMSSIFVFANLFKFSLLTAESQMTFAAVGVLFLWMKLFDWMRLFDNTAFFIRLLTETIRDISHFGIIMIILLMGFGSAIWFLSLNRNANDQGELVSQISRVWFVNTFQYIY